MSKDAIKISFLMYFLVIGICLGFSFPVEAKQSDLTLDHAQDLALKNSHILQKYDAEIKAVKIMSKAAYELPDPLLTFGIDNLPIDGEDKFNLSNDFMTMRRIGIMQEMTRKQKRQLRSEQFVQQAQLILAKKNEAITRIERDTALAWLKLYYADAMFKKINTLKKAYENNTKATEASYRAGKNTAAEALQTHVLATQLKNKSDALQRQIKTAHIDLERWVGKTEVITLHSLPNIYSLNFESNNLKSHLLNHPEIIVLSKKIDIANTEVQLAQANKKSDWSLELSLQQRGSAYSNMVSLGASIPLQLDQKNRQNNQVIAQQFLVEAALSERDETLKKHIAEIQSDIETWHELNERKKRYQKILIPLIKNQTQSIMAAYQGGKSTLLDVLQARQTEIEIDIEVLELESDIAMVWAKINFILPRSFTSKNSHKDNL
ncbi:MAG: TolC family protein [Pseudomonadota bacterium]